MRKNPNIEKWIADNTNKHRCECNCGQFVIPNRIRYYDKNRRWFINYHQNRCSNHPLWKGGIVKAKGYIWVRITGFHPRKTPRGYVKQCWLVMEKKIGRFLNPDELIHHKNHVKTDDCIKNLEIVDRVTHGKIHNTGAGNWLYRHDVDARTHVLPLIKKGYSIGEMVKMLHCSDATIDRRIRELRAEGLVPRG